MLNSLSVPLSFIFDGVFLTLIFSALPLFKVFLIIFKLFSFAAWFSSYVFLLFGDPHGDI
jgi:hypothetical protein